MEREAVSGVCCKKDQRNEKIAKGDVGLKEGFSYGKILFLNRYSHSSDGQQIERQKMMMQ